MESAIEPTVEMRPPRLRMMMKIVVGLGVFWVVLQLLGVDVRGRLDNLWDQIGAIWEHNPGYIVAASAIGVAMNGSLPANIGTFVTLLMFSPPDDA